MPENPITWSSAAPGWIGFQAYVTRLQIRTFDGRVRGDACATHRSGLYGQSCGQQTGWIDVLARMTYSLVSRPLC